MFSINYLLLLLFCMTSVLSLNGNKLSQQTISDTLDKDFESKWSCEQLDYCSDQLGFEAILWLHKQLDDDLDGNVDIAESDGFLRGELQYENDYERQKAFHGNDKHITVDELWKSWKNSEVRNWTTDETVEWLSSAVELPQYAEHFRKSAVAGIVLPRLAANPQLISILGITNPIHKQKLALKAMDVVLFGVPKHHNFVKDILLTVSLVIAIGGVWFAYVQHKYSQSHLKKMMRDMDSLQKAEEQLTRLQVELDTTRREQQNVVKEKTNLEKKLKENESHFDRSASYTGLTDLSRVSELEDELSRTREELRRAENAMMSRSWIPPHQLQHWLQITHELEIKSYNAKRCAAELQLLGAKEGCEKLRKKRSTLLGAFRVAHGSSIDDVDNRILQAKASLSEVTKDLQERLHRWRQIELYCGFPIVHNPGLQYLESQLYGSPVNGKSGVGLSRAGSEGTIVDDDGMPLSTATLPSNPSLSMSDNSEIAVNSKGSITNFSHSGPHIRSTRDQSSMFSLNLNNSSNNISQKQSQTMITPSSIATYSTYSSSFAPETTDEELDDDYESSDKLTEFTIGSSSIKDNENNNSYNSGAKLVKSFSEDSGSVCKDDKLDNHICHSESCSELVSNQDLRSTSDSPKSITSGDEKSITQLNKSFDEETGSTDSNSIKDFDCKPISEKKRTFFGLRKRKNSKQS